jgi:hypothetical protein
MNLLNVEERRAFMKEYFLVAVDYVVSTYFLAVMLFYLFRLPLEWMLCVQVSGALIFLSQVLFVNAKLPISLRKKKGEQKHEY